MPISSAVASAAQRVFASLARGQSTEEDVAKTAEWARKNVDKFKCDSVYREKSEAVADDDAPPMQDATGSSQDNKKRLDDIWEYLGECGEAPLHDLDDFLGVFGEDLVSVICDESPAVVEGTKCESAVVADARCHSPAVAEGTTCESAVVAET